VSYLILISFNVSKGELYGLKIGDCVDNSAVNVMVTGSSLLGVNVI